MNSQGVILERLVGRSWHIVGRAVSGRTGTYTLIATPPYRGSNTYRVAVSSRADVARDAGEPRGRSSWSAPDSRSAVPGELPSVVRWGRGHGTFT